MPRVRCHWALLGRTREALAAWSPAAQELVARHRGAFYAGGIAPDAIRLFAGVDKRNSHFYDDRRPETWDQVVMALLAAYPDLAQPGQAQPARHAWVLGYLTHILTDIAYWRHVLSHLAPFPEEAELHHGAWMLADDVTLTPDERSLDLATVDFEAVPPWISADAVRELLARLNQRILKAEGPWETELAYSRGYPDAVGRDPEELLRERLPRWQAAMAQSQARLGPDVWTTFRESALQGAVEAIGAYLAHVEASGSRPAPAAS